MLLDERKPIDRSTLLRDLISGWTLLSSGERRQASLLGASNVVNSFLQTAVLTAIVPFIQIIMEPSQIERSRWLRWLAEWSGLSSPHHLLIAVGVIFVGLVFFKNGYGWYHMRWQHDFCANCEHRLGSALLRQALEAPYEWAIKQNSAVITEIILGNVVLWSRGFVKMALQISNDLLFVLMTVGVLIYASPMAGFTVCLAAAGLGWALFRVARPITMAYAKSKQLAIRRAVVIGTQSVAGIKEVKMTGSEPFFEEQFGTAFRSATIAQSRMSQWQQMPRMGIEVIGYSAMVIVSLLAIGTGLGRAETIALLALYALAAVRVLPIVSNVVVSLGSLVNTFPLIEEIEQLQRDSAAGLHPSQQGEPNPTVFDRWGALEADGVSYRYPGSERDALQNVSFRLERGKTYGLVGPSGAGKSTCVDLLVGLLRPTHGEISIDGRLLGLENQAAWRRQLGYVSQSPFLLDGTLRENITFGVSLQRVDQGRLHNCLELSHLTEMVKGLPEGLETQVGERGVRLSGGQRQKVAIARALYREAQLLILDEATNALDALSEQEITNAIASLSGRLTIVIIAHRLGTVAHCDQLLVFQQGRIVDMGNHRELLRSSSIYQQLVDAQFGGLEVLADKIG